MKRLKTLEADLQNLSIVADEPSSFRIRKSDCPITAYLWQFEPGLSFIGAPRGRAGAKVRLSLRRDHHTPVVFMAEVVSMAPIIAVFHATHIGKTEDRSRNRRLRRKRPSLAAVIRGCGLRSAVRGQVAATHNAVPRIAESH